MKQQYKKYIIQMVNEIDSADLLKKIYTFVRTLIKISK